MIITVLSISAFFIAIFCYLFFAPFYLEINLAKELYGIRFHRFASMRVKGLGDSPSLELKIVGWIKTWDLSPNYFNRPNTHPVKKNSEAQHKAISWKRIKNVLKSFHINQLYVSIDSGNNELNGILYPLFYLIAAKTGKSIQINFIKENQVIIEIENSLARMSWAYISS